MKSKIFQSLKTAAAVSCALLGAALLTACSDGKKVGDVSLGFLTFKTSRSTLSLTLKCLA